MQPPPSLRNILREWQVDLGISAVPTGDLTAWAQQGVLLMNRVLTVLPGDPGSHRNLGWEHFTNLIIKRLSEDAIFRIFCLWGNDARQLNSLIGEGNGVMQSAHPSPLSAHRGFFGSKPFSSVNRLLREQGLSELDWSLPLDLSGDREGHTGQLFGF
jgi:uracil-DNA glycosylase